MAKTILCIDDENSVLTSLKTQLDNFFSEDYEIELAQSGEEALEIIDELIKDKVDLLLIISDFQMPAMKGDELLIKAHKVVKNTKKILLTGQANMQGVTNLVNHESLYRYISKPWEQSDLVMTVKEALKSYEDEAEIENNRHNLELLVEQKIAENKSYLEMINKHIIFSNTDLDGKITKVSDAFCKTTQYSRDELMGKKHPIIRSEKLQKETFKQLRDCMDLGKDWHGEIKNHKKNDDLYWIECRVSPIVDEKTNPIGYTEISTDITDKKRVEELSITDDMTQLYNRRFFNNIFEKEIASGSKESTNIGFTILDIDHFKQFNDTYGHQEGDKTLMSISNCLKNELHRARDYAFRLGGEEFGILILNTDLEAFEELNKKLKESIENMKIEHSGNSASSYVTASFGGAIFKCSDEIVTDQIFKFADDLLYEVKKSGRNSLLVKEYKS